MKIWAISVGVLYLILWLPPHLTLYFIHHLFIANYESTLPFCNISITFDKENLEASPLKCLVFYN